MSILSKIQMQNYLSISGYKYDGISLKGEFQTEFPYNDKEWNLSPWRFKFIIEEETGNLFCELSHRMTNNRMFGWNKLGNKLPYQVISKYFPNTDPFIEG